MQFSVYLKGSDLSGVAPHRGSRILALAALRADLAVRRGQNVIQLTTARSWKDVKEYLRGSGDSEKGHLLNKPDYFTLPYTYPLPYDVLRHYQAARA